MSLWNVHSEPNHLPPSDVRPGHFYTINRTTDLGETVGRFYNVWTGGGEANLRPAKTSSSLHTPSSKSQTTSPTASSKLFFSLPYRDLEGRGLVMSISQAFYDEARLIRDKPRLVRSTIYLRNTLARPHNPLLDPNKSSIE
ncbi:unnamed protein product [Mesocestoides corti]|uniref:Uncharacterized protein n=1 Tax=Mesocestoides corti TaxID=53468 RepID=A0A0R3UQK3_MESCO|nr:unnamed protein product [Mesocestoides corti]